MLVNNVILYLHISVDNSTLRRLLESSAVWLVPDDPVDGVGNLLLINGDVALGLVETLRNKRTQPAQIS